jgi:hypothetical protein
MTRRIGALFGMVVLLGLALLLMWNVYVHHARGVVAEEPPVVSVKSLKVACALL